MPYIDIKVTGKLSDAEKDKMKSKFGELITLLPGKTEAVLMICISDESTIYFSGLKKEKAAFINIKLFRESGFEYKEEFTKKTFEFLDQEFEITRDSIFLTFDEYNSWGSNGSLNK